MSDHANFAKTQEREQEERQAGAAIAVGCYLEVTAPPSGELGKITFEPDGSVKLTTGTLDYGPGPRHAVRAGAFRRARRALREDHARTGPTAISCGFGNGTGGSRSITATGQAIVESSALVIEKRQEGRGASDGGGRGRYRIRQWPFHHRGYRPQHRHHGTGAGGFARARCPRMCRHRSTSTTPPRIRRRPSPMAAMSPRSRSIPRPA